METRLGDIIDDYCIKCKRLTNHAVVSMLGPDPAKVRCRTCYSDHDYRREQAPPPKVDPRKAALISEAAEKGNAPEESSEAPAGEVPAEVSNDAAVVNGKPKKGKK